MDAIKHTYAGQKALRDFAPFPTDVTATQIPAHWEPCRDVFMAGPMDASGPHARVHTALRQAADHVHWRATYADTDIGDVFMQNFGCFTIIGEEAPFTSGQGRAWMTYMPAGLVYPWHHHPAEEMYFVVSGQAVFRRKGQDDVVLTAGDTMFHASNLPHAMSTTTSPVLCLVFWRNEFDTPPELTP